ncbi:Putative CRISPR-associated endonuclease Cas2 [Desulfonema limicola]|uniref:CRISPR-associated endoribonuclease Cas2 n=1 Tax=Desulfonema limicola TaxID=45656 RepID=A0A975B7J5_9BACT|nr:CRISPR-associated endonuclease Cas2 [Desulfonema limicola]QTA80268.1 Putative CRISPR-associated endonuclease Cas2 [Desulfonema limicola]
MPRKNTYIISYDISKDRQRARAANTIKDYGIRVQKSVFECRVRPNAFLELMAKLEKIIDPKTDSVLGYLVCEACFKRKQAIGQNTVLEEEDFFVI